MTKVYLDHASFPHLIDLIIYNSPISVLKAFRLTSRYYADRIDTWLAHHIILHSNEEIYPRRIRRSTYEAVLQAYFPKGTREGTLCIRMDRDKGDISRPWNNIDLFSFVKIMDVKRRSFLTIQLYTDEPVLEVVRVTRECSQTPPSARTIVVHGSFFYPIWQHPSTSISLQSTDRLIVHAISRLPSDRGVVGDFGLGRIWWSDGWKGINELVLIGNGRCDLDRLAEDVLGLLYFRTHTPVRGITVVDLGREEKCFFDLLDSRSSSSRWPVAWWDVTWKFVTREQYAKTLTAEEVELFLGESV